MRSRVKSRRSEPLYVRRAPMTAAVALHIDTDRFDGLRHPRAGHTSLAPTCACKSSPFRLSSPSKVYAPEALYRFSPSRLGAERKDGGEQHPAHGHFTCSGRMYY